MHACGYPDPPSDWDSVVVWSVAKLKGKSLKACLAKLCLGACILIFQNREPSIFSFQYLPPPFHKRFFHSWFPSNCYEHYF
jgi:hypothetical protein